jgi:hypothetical protein
MKGRQVIILCHQHLSTLKFEGGDLQCAGTTCTAINGHLTTSVIAFLLLFLITDLEANPLMF